MSLRLIEMVVSETVEEPHLLDEPRVLGVWREPIDGELMLVRVLTRSQYAEAVMHELEAKYGGRPEFRLLLLEVQATIPVPEEEVAPPAPAEAQAGAPKDPQRVACAELVEKLASGAVVNRVYFLTVVLSTVVAAVGLMRDSVAIIVGAMVIAPLLGPNITLALATTLGDGKLARRALKVLGVGVLLSLLLAVAIGACFSANPYATAIVGRSRVAGSDLAVALAAGSAGALAFTTGLSEALVGVMVAVALLPPLVTAGLLAGQGDWRAAEGALLLTASNIVCVNLAAVATFLWQGVRPNRWWEAERARKMVRWAGAVWLGLLVVLVLLILLSHRA